MTEFRILGPIEVVDGGAPIEVGSPKERAVLAMLAADSGRAVSTDRLIMGLWGDQPPRTALATTRTYVSHLRDALDEIGESSLIETIDNGYRLAVEPQQIDAVRFEQLVNRGDRAVADDSYNEASAAFTSALNLWRGQPLADLPDDDRARIESHRLDGIRIHALEERINADLHLGKHGEVVGQLEALVAEHPLSERFAELLMTALYRSGRQADALRVYQDTRHILGEELGIEPGPELQRLEDAILLQDPGLEPPPARRPLAPTGIVTFLFASIEGSTRLWEQYPEAMKKALARHHQIMGDAFDRYRGYVFSSGGDTFSGAFWRAQEAVAAAVDAQQSLQSEDWGETPIQVRMAVHTGEAEHQEGEYAGPVASQCARLLAAAHGGQILVSAATRELIGNRLPVQIELLDLGEHQLTDLHWAAHLYQVIHPDLERHFPALRRVARPSHNLPVQLTSFVGRTQELAEVDKLIRGSRLVTLTGSGGSGKTRLALKAAEDLLEEFPDGVWLVELAAMEQPGLVTGQIIKLFGLKDQGVRSAAELLREYLQLKRLLLIVDNCEHLIDEAAETVAQLLTATSHVRILVTSREPLHVPSEVIYQVPTMAIPDPDTPLDQLMRYDGIRLLIERSEHALPGFRLTKSNAPALASITSRLDGIPLAIELAAAQLRTLGAEAVASRLDEQLQLLARRARGVPDRHQTLAATIDWSYRLLTDAERSILGCLSVFRGNFDLAAVESVCATDGSAVVDTLAGLVDKSLVVGGSPPDESRFRLLEAIRQFAELTLSEEDLADLHLRHAIHYAGRVENAEVDLWEDQDAYLARTAADYENLVAALSRSLANDDYELAGRLLSGLRGYWRSTSIPAAARQWADATLAGVEEMSPLTAGLAYLAAGNVYLPVDLGKAGSYIESAVAVLETLVVQDEPLAAHYLSALHIHGISLWFSGDRDAALGTANRTLKVARRFGYRHHEALALSNLSVTVLWQDPERAANLAAEALEIFEEQGPPSQIAGAMQVLGAAKWYAGDHIGGEEWMTKALEHGKKHDFRPLVLDTRVDLAHLLVETGRFSEALGLLEDNLAEMEGTTYRETTLAGVALVASRVGEHEIAAALASMVRRISDRSGQRAPMLLQLLESAESTAQESLSAEDMGQAVERGEELNPLDMTEVIHEIRTRLGNQHPSTQ